PGTRPRSELSRRSGAASRAGARRRDDVRAKKRGRPRKTRPPVGSEERGSEAVVHADQEGAAVLLEVDGAAFVAVLEGLDRLVGQVVDLGQDRQTLGRARLELVADLGVDDAFRRHGAQGAAVAEAGDLAQEVR